MTRTCGWCRGPIPARSRRDAKYCRVQCRQAAHRATIGRVNLAATTAPARLVYADPPYVGKAARYYGTEPTYAGEVDHWDLLGRLGEFDGWALSCSSSSIPMLLGLARSRGLNPRLAIWHRRPAPHPSAGIVTAYEGVIYQGARPVARIPETAALTDVLLDVEAHARPTLPTSVIGMKPPAFCEWLFRLLGALPGDTLTDLYPGSGLVARSWRLWTSGNVDGIEQRTLAELGA